MAQYDNPVVSPEILPDDIAALRALVVAAWAEREAERAEKARLIEERDQLVGQNDRLRHLIRQLQRRQFGRRSEKLDPDQFNLALEDLEQAAAASQAEQEKADPRCARPAVDRDKLVAALETGNSWHAVGTKTRIPYSTVKKHARALGYQPQRAKTIYIPDG